MDSSAQSLSTPLKFGIITGLIYCVLIFCQNQFFYANPLQFTITKFLCYLIIITSFFYVGYLSRQELGGFISFKECLRAILLVILITELFYLVFSTLYVKYIDPSFFDKLKSSWIVYFNSHNVPQDKINDTIQKFNDAGKITIVSLIQSFGFSLIIDSIFGVIIAAILKKNRPEFENQINP
ncbi:MAG: DUF4199 domain-containing protein [Bacteroidota bacterium]|nr:DUF4199 domain-containing protein [Bacteroidota bacterium]MDQ6890783.1 DUF4199 domain-containing protein [Bacteroidota bacterium]